MNTFPTHWIYVLRIPGRAGAMLRTFPAYGLEQAKRIARKRCDEDPRIFALAIHSVTSNETLFGTFKPDTQSRINWRLQ